MLLMMMMMIVLLLMVDVPFPWVLVELWDVFCTLQVRNVFVRAQFLAYSMIISRQSEHFVFVSLFIANHIK